MNILSSLLNFIGLTIGADPNTLTTTSKTLVGAINEVGSGDYIVEQGTSGIWTYRKWKSGIAECWGKDAGATYSTSAWGNLYYIRKDSVETYPTGLFIEVPVAKTWFTSQADFVSSPRGLGTAVATPTVLGLRGTTLSNTTAYANYYAIGKWK